MNPKHKVGTMLYSKDHKTLGQIVASRRLREELNYIYEIYWFNVATTIVHFESDVEEYKRQYVRLNYRVRMDLR
jgi:hypothetical protein